MMKVETTLNSDVKIALVPEDQRDKTINRLAFDGNLVQSVDLREDGALIFTLAKKATTDPMILTKWKRVISAEGVE